MKSKISKIKEKYDNFNKKYNKETYSECAKVIVGVKTIKYAIFKLPEAIQAKKNDTNDYQNSLYKNNSVLDYIENPDFEYDEEVERISNIIEDNVNKVNQFINKAKKLTNPLYWIKKLINKIRNNNVKLLGEGSNLKSQEEIKSTFREDRDNFIENLKYVSNEEVLTENKQSNFQKIKQEIQQEQDYELDIN